MFELHERIRKEDIAKCLKRDPLFTKTLGIKNTHKALKAGGILVISWLLILAVTPLPENLFLSRIGLVALLLTFGACWAADIGYHLANIDKASENLETILKKDPKIKIVTDGETNTIIHQRFTAECSAMTQLDLKAMLEVEIEVKEAIQSVLDKPSLWKHQKKDEEKSKA